MLYAPNSKLSLIVHPSECALILSHITYLLAICLESDLPFVFPAFTWSPKLSEGHRMSDLLFKAPI